MSFCKSFTAFLSANWLHNRFSYSTSSSILFAIDTSRGEDHRRESCRGRGKVRILTRGHPYKAILTISAEPRLTSEVMLVDYYVHHLIIRYVILSKFKPVLYRGIRVGFNRFFRLPIKVQILSDLKKKYIYI